MRSFLFIFLFILTTQVYAVCDTQVIEEVSNDGYEITLVNGTVWRVLFDNNALGWGADDEVLMCGDGSMVNKETDAKVAVTQIKY